MAKVTLQTIADEVGVSRMTVSNAFSRPDQLSEELRVRILAVAERLGYAGPDPAARALARGTTGAVGVLLTDSLHTAFTDEVATGLLAAIVDELRPTGLALTLLTTEADGEAVPARDVAIDGAIVYSCDAGSEALEWLHRRRLPLVYVDQDPVEGVPCVNVDDRGGARAAAQHLVDLGHRRLVALTVRLDGEVADATGSHPHPQRERLAGWQQVAGAVGAELVVVELDGHDDVAAAEAVRPVLDAADHPTGILCFSDLLASGVVRAARELGLEVPRDLSVVGFDDSPSALRSEPPLTTVRQDLVVKGRRAALALRSELDDASDPVVGPLERLHVLLPTELVVRDSSAPPA